MPTFLKNNDTFKWTVRLCNTGPGNSTNTLAALTIPLGVSILDVNATQGTYDTGTSIWTVGTIVAGATCPTLVITVKVVDQSLAPFTASATVTGDQFDPVTIDNIDSSIVGDVCEDMLTCFQMVGGDGTTVTGDGSTSSPYSISFSPTNLTPATWNSFNNVLKIQNDEIVYGAQITGSNLELLNGAGNIVDTIPLDGANDPVEVSADAGNILVAGTDGGPLLTAGALPILANDDQTLDGNRVVDGNGFTLSFNNLTDFNVSGKITLDGMVRNSTGVEMVPQAANPADGTGVEDETLWIDQSTGHLMRGNVDIEASVGATDVFVNGASWDPTNLKLVLTDNDGGSPDVEVTFTQLRSIVTDNADGTYTHNNGSGVGNVTVDTRVTTDVSGSLTGDGKATHLKLQGDVLAPGNSFYYGTNASGTKGFFALPVDYTSANFDSDLATKDTDDLSEGATNQYFTEARVLNTTLTGMILTDPSAVDATDDIITAAGKLQRQVNDLSSSSGIPASTVDAKGDLLVATADDSVTRLAAGVNGEFLQADSNQASGLQWASLSGEATMAVGGGVTLDNASVIAKVLTGYSADAGTVSAADSLIGAIQKVDGNHQDFVTNLKHVHTFTTGDFSSGVLTVTAATHGKGTNPTVQVWEVNGTDYDLKTVNRLYINGSGDVTIVVTDGSGEFNGKLIIA